MRRLVLAVSLALGYSAMAPAFPNLGLGSVASAAEVVSADSALRALNAEEVRAFMTGDASGLERLWSDSFVVTNPLNQFVTKTQVLQMVDSGTLRFASYDRQVEYVHFYGNIAILAGAETVVWAGKMPMAGQLSHLRFTAVWQLSGRDWREVARHANIVPEH
jgi:hypothetical protein